MIKLQKYHQKKVIIVTVKLVDIYGVEGLVLGTACTDGPSQWPAEFYVLNWWW